MQIQKKNNKASDIRDLMLDWYDHHRRDLPWRAQPHMRPDPYHVWLSEVMLQQTTVQAVKPYFEKFLNLWPSIESLANASQDDVLAAWAGLGYYSRARNLHKCAHQIVSENGGVFPHDSQSLKSLAGIGDYTTAAIRSIAFDIPDTVIDGNVERVVSRLYKIETPLPNSKPEIRLYATELFEGENVDRPSCFAQSMMDLGATICTPKSPQCPSCPLNNACMAYHDGVAGDYPKRLRKKPVPKKHAIAYIYYNDKGIRLEKRPEKGMLAGMWGIPTSEWIDHSIDLQEKYDQNLFIDHVFTHFALRLYPVFIKVQDTNMTPYKEVDDIGLPTLFKKLWKIMPDYIE